MLFPPCEKVIFKNVMESFSLQFCKESVASLNESNHWIAAMNQINESNQWIESMNRIKESNQESNQWIKSKNWIKESNQRIEPRYRINESNQWIESINRTLYTIHLHLHLHYRLTLRAYTRHLHSTLTLYTYPYTIHLPYTLTCADVDAECAQRGAELDSAQRAGAVGVVRGEDGADRRLRQGKCIG